ncbi:MAG: sugar transferase [Actinobacteria bacterium]|nr:sugar transferase [Actinomycetota bacterium]
MARRPTSTPPPRRLVKQMIDVVGAAGGLVVLSPVLAVVAILVRLRLGRPVLFTQVRTGLGGRLFTIYKFRTMTDARDAAGNLLPDGERLTSFGRFLRSTSLDELPELINVMKGEMSLVGPRPLLPEYLDRYDERQCRRHELKPGITGWGQVKGRNALTWEDKLELDVWYVDHASVSLDLRILASTLRAVLTRHGIAPEGEATMPRFLGNPLTGAGRDQPGDGEASLRPRPEEVDGA